MNTDSRSRPLSGNPAERPLGTRRAFLALGVLAVLAPAGGAGCGGNPNEQAILQGPPGVPSTDPGEPDDYVEPPDNARRRAPAKKS